MLLKQALLCIFLILSLMPALADESRFFLIRQNNAMMGRDLSIVRKDSPGNTIFIHDVQPAEVSPLGELHLKNGWVYLRRERRDFLIGSILGREDSVDQEDTVAYEIEFFYPGIQVEDNGISVSRVIEREQEYETGLEDPVRGITMDQIFLYSRRAAPGWLYLGVVEDEAGNRLEDPFDRSGQVTCRPLKLPYSGIPIYDPGSRTLKLLAEGNLEIFLGSTGQAIQKGSFSIYPVRFSPLVRLESKQTAREGATVLSYELDLAKAHRLATRRKELEALVGKVTSRPPTLDFLSPRRGSSPQLEPQIDAYLAALRTQFNSSHSPEDVEKMMDHMRERLLNRSLGVDRLTSTEGFGGDLMDRIKETTHAFYHLAFLIWHARTHETEKPETLKRWTQEAHEILVEIVLLAGNAQGRVEHLKIWNRRLSIMGAAFLTGPSIAFWPLWIPTVVLAINATGKLPLGGFPFARRRPDIEEAVNRTKGLASNQIQVFTSGPDGRSEWAEFADLPFYEQLLRVLSDATNNSIAEHEWCRSALEGAQ